VSAHYCIINFLQVAPLLSAYYNVEFHVSELCDLRLGILHQSVVSATHQTAQCFYQRARYKKLAVRNFFIPGGMRKVLSPTVKFQEIYLI
jgi:hypothetical protein